MRGKFPRHINRPDWWNWRCGATCFSPETFWLLERCRASCVCMQTAQRVRDCKTPIRRVSVSPQWVRGKARERERERCRLIEAKVVCHLECRAPSKQDQHALITSFPLHSVAGLPSVSPSGYRAYFRLQGALCNIFTGCKQTKKKFLMQETVVCRS